MSAKKARVPEYSPETCDAFHGSAGGISVMILRLLVILLWVLAGGNEAFAGARIEKGLEYLRQ